jgi:hypothetical protein
MTSDKWRRETTALDAIAMVVGISDHLNRITLHSWNETGFAQIWDEATEAQDEIAELHLLLQQTWEQLYTAAVREARGE